MMNIKTLLLLLLASSLIACGGGGESASSPEEEAQVLGGGSSSQSITKINGRSTAIDAMELLGILINYEKFLGDNLEAPSTGQCSKGGEKVVQITDADASFGNQGDIAQISYTQCMDSMGTLKFTLDGQYTATFELGKIHLSSSSFTINTREGNWKLIPLDLNIVTNESPNILLAKMTMVGGPSDLTLDAVSEQAPLAGANLLCPDSGKFTLTAKDGSSITINGAPGDNLLLDIEGESNTLACNEIMINQEPPSGEGELVPPGAP